MELLIYLLRFFLIDFHFKYFRLFLRFEMLLDHQFGMKVMMRSLFKPLFGFQGFLSRVNGFVIRSLALFLGTLILILSVALGVAFYFAILYSLIFVFSKGIIYGLIYILFVILIKSYQYFHFYGPSIIDYKNLKDYIRSGNGRSRKVFKYAKKSKVNRLIEILSKDRRVNEMILRTELSPGLVFDFIRSQQDMFSHEKFLKTLMELAESTELHYLGDTLTFSALLLHFDESDDFLSKQDSSKDIIKGALEYTAILHRDEPTIWDDEYIIPPSGGIDKGWAVSFTATLNQFSTDLTKEALRGLLPKLIGREEVKNQTIAILSKKSKNNLLLIGDAGCGKTTFVHALTREIAVGTKIEALRYKRIVSLDIAALTAGTKGEINDRMSKITKEIKNAGNIVLFVDEVHNLSSTLSEDPNAVSVFSALEPYLSQGKFQFIGATSRANYNKYIRPNEAFSKDFDLIEMRNTNEIETLRILMHFGKKLERSSKNFMITYPAIHNSYVLSNRYITVSALPDKAVELLNQAYADQYNQEKSKLEKEDISQVVSEMTNMPLTAMKLDEKKALVDLEENLHKRIIGQNVSIKAISNAIKRARVGVRDEEKPIASFLFSGPTGVGKTETAKALADIYYGSEKALIRFDMSEYQDVQSIRRFIGDEKGGEGQLTSKVKERPFSLLLFDEIEKADRNVINVFLQILDDGRLTSAMGVVTDFSNTLIIMTSNVGTKDIVNALSAEKSNDEVYDLTLRALKEHFPLEFLNRFTALIPYHPLSKNQIFEIAKIKLSKLQKKLVKKNIIVDFTEGTIRKVAQLGYTKEWGARPINRVIEEKIETVIADDIISEKVKPGSKFVFKNL